MSRAADKEELRIAGPAGRLQSVLEWPMPVANEAGVARVAIVCHPHPQHQGTMFNKVVHTLVRAHTELGMPALRFNFRGVGDSEGSFDGGHGEGDDLLAVAAYANERWPGAGIWLAGFSFGGMIAAGRASAIAAEQLTTIAPAVNLMGDGSGALPAMPWLIVQGDADEIVPVAAVRTWVAAHQPGPELVIMPGVGHFFHGELVTLRKLLIQKLKTNAGKT